VAIRLRSRRWARNWAPKSVAWFEVDVLYCSSSRSPDLEAMGVVSDLVVVKASKTKLACSTFFDSGVAEYESSDRSRCPRRVVFPEPDSPLSRVRRYVSHCEWAPTERRRLGLLSAAPTGRMRAGPAPQLLDARFHPCRRRPGSDPYLCSVRQSRVRRGG
jgi:hypothetical protein